MSHSTPSSRAATARRLTETAARACASLIGKNDKDAADAAAVEALREAAPNLGLRGRVVIGEGEKDGAPFLAPGSRIGTGSEEPSVDVAVDPLEGTELVATDAPGALSAVALAPAGTMMRLGRAFYAEKLIGPPGTGDVLDLDASPRRVVEGVADVVGLDRSDVRVAVQDRPRHAGLVAALRRAGARVRLFGEGDLSFAVLALQKRAREAEASGVGRRSEGPVDLVWGIGGAPEGMLAAAAQRAIGGSVRLRLAPRSTAERRRLHTDPGLPRVLDRSFRARDLINSDVVVAALTGVTDGPLVEGVRRGAEAVRTETLVLTPNGPVRRVRTDHERCA